MVRKNKKPKFDIGGFIKQMGLILIYVGIITSFFTWLGWDNKQIAIMLAVIGVSHFIFQFIEDETNGT